MPSRDIEQRHHSAKADRACTICRERKIRCGREHPKCGNCKRQGLKCDYSAPEKRVSHIKLLCDNVVSLDNRLGHIETEISRLANPRGSGHPARTLESSLVGTPVSQQDAEEDINHPLLTDRQILHSDSTDRYYGPDTLYTWCVSFKDFALTERDSRTNSKYASPTPDLNPAIGDPTNLLDQHIAELLKAAETQHICDIDTSDGQIFLPPRQFLPMFHTRFSHQSDWSTDLFVHSRFWRNVERAYTQYSPTLDEPWAIVFNVIILLAWSTEDPLHGHGTITGSQFAGPFFSTIRVALKKFHILQAPRLINVQALALLSLAAELFYPPGVAECLLAQACILARRMGLNQVDMVGQGFDAAEQEERVKVYRSLYIRDKSLGISRGTPCWLPGFEIQLLSMDNGEPAETSYNAARVKISALQERVYRLRSSAKAEGGFAHTAGFYPSAIQIGVANLLEAEAIFGPDTSNVPDLDLWLEFLATRITALRRKPTPSCVDCTLKDCRACCILLLIAFDKSNDDLNQRLHSFCGMSNGSQHSATQSSEPWKGIKQQQQVQNLLNIFPTSALFLMAANIIRPMTAEQSSTEDLDLLSGVRACYREASERLEATNRAYQVGQILGKLLEVIEHLNGAIFTQGLSLTTTRTTATDGSRDTQSSPSFLHHLKTSDSDPMNMQQLSAHDYMTMSNSTEQQDSAAAFSAPGVNPMNTFMMGTQPSSTMDPATQMQLNDSLMMFAEPGCMTQSQFASDNYGMSVCLPDGAIEPENGLRTTV